METNQSWRLPDGDLLIAATFQKYQESFNFWNERGVNVKRLFLTISPSLFAFGVSSAHLVDRVISEK